MASEPGDRTGRDDMAPRNAIRRAATAALVALAALGCERDTSMLQPAPPVTDPLVFDDTFGSDVIFQAFLGSKLDAVTIDEAEKSMGTASMKIAVPRPGDGSGVYSGGACTTFQARDLSRYDALTFWATASRPATLDVAGLGNDNTGTSLYAAEWKNIVLSTGWRKYVIPIPLPEKLTVEQGMFFFAEGPEAGAGYDLWFDEVRFETDPTITNPRPAMDTQTLGVFVGATVTPSGTRTIFNVAGRDQVIDHMPAYFTYASSDSSVATIVDGEILVVGAGTADITATLDTVSVSGTLTLNASGAPTTPAPTPTVPAGDVISLFSNAYNDVVVDTWLTDWSRDYADLTEFQIDGDDVKAYSNLIFAGIEFASETIDASGMTHFHMDLWLPEGTVLFKVKLVDFGADGEFGGTEENQDSEHELTFTTTSIPPLTTENWIGLDIPLEDFMNGPKGLFSREHLAQLIISGTGNTAFLDNIYFHRQTAPTKPESQR
jgi:hypothetical protein